MPKSDGPRLYLSICFVYDGEGGRIHAAVAALHREHKNRNDLFVVSIIIFLLWVNLFMIFVLNLLMVLYTIFVVLSDHQLIYFF